MVSLTRIASPETIDWVDRVRPPDYDSHKARTEENANAQFIGIDGEATRNGNDYCLLSCGTESLYHPDGSILGLEEIFSFLYDQYKKHPKAIFVGFFLAYDFTKWLQHLPEERARMLFTPEGIARRQRKKYPGMPFAVRYQRWEFDILGMKRFKLRPHNPYRKRRKDDSDSRSGWMYICDAGPFFQASFLKVIERDPKKWPDGFICTEAEYEQIRIGKEKRASASLDADMIRYNLLEIEILARLMTVYRDGLNQIGIRLSKSQWFGPGQVASKWLHQHKGTIPSRDTREQVIPGFAHKTATAAYYGGWFEIFMHGTISGKTYQYDINSAYPSEIEKLPCILHGTWRQGVGKPPGDATITFATVRMHSLDRFVGAMPYRDKDGHISRPSYVQGTYWDREIKASVRTLRATVDEWISWTAFYQECECPPPLRDIRTLYERRLVVGKETTQGKAYKLTYNSPYGKFAESVGDDPLWSNPVYASLITAGTRVRILDVIATHPTRTKDLAMVATDGIYFTREHPGIVPSKLLGEWSREVKNTITLVMPGMYWDNEQRLAEGPNGTIRSRGMPARTLRPYLPEFERLFEVAGQKLDRSISRKKLNTFSYGFRYGAEGSYDYDWPVVYEIPIPFTIVTPRLALQRGTWDQAGLCKPGARDVNSWPGNKRAISSVYRDAKGIVRTLPILGINNPPSQPYSKTFGRTLAEGEYDMTPDGPGLLLREGFE